MLFEIRVTNTYRVEAEKDPTPSDINYFLQYSPETQANEFFTTRQVFEIPSDPTSPRRVVDAGDLNAS